MIQTLAIAPSSLPMDASTLEASISALKSSISALESSLNTLEGSSGFWETLAWSCALAVGIGIVGEIVVIVSEHREDFAAWRRGIVRPPDRPSVWRFWFDIIATLLVLIGVFGEARASMKLASINSQLRSKTSELRAKSDQLVALVTSEAGSAALSAESAKQSAELARAASGSAINKANEAQGTVMKVAEKAEAVDLDLDTSQWLLAERDILNAEPLVDELKKFGARDSVFESYVGNVEAWGFCTQLVNIFSSAGWRPQNRCGLKPFTVPPVDGAMTVSAPNQEEAAALGAMISRAAKLQSFSPGHNAPIVTVFVGEKQGFRRGQAHGARDAGKNAKAK